jgi:hypothetical protein
MKRNPSSASKLTKRPIGWILLDGGFISPDELERALSEQRHSKELLGEILVCMGALKPDELKAVLSIQRDLSSLGEAVKLSSGIHHMLGELLVQSGRITQGQLEDALTEQGIKGGKLGEILIRIGALKKQELDAVLTFQSHQSDPMHVGRLRLGELMVATGLITRSQLDEVLRLKKHSPDRRIRELLVESGYVTHEHVHRTTELQRKLLAAAAAAIVFLAPLFWPVETSALTASSRLSVSAAVIEHMSLRVIDQSREVVVTHSDVLRGYMETPSAFLFEIKSNSGFLVSFDLMGEPFEGVHIKGLGQEVFIGPGTGSVYVPDSSGTDTYALSYRFILSKDAHPGTYAWPVLVTISPQ